MSDYAVTEYDNKPMSAWEFRYLYLSDGIRYDSFYCPFCAIKLCAFLIYTDGESSRSPYFSARWEPHRYECNGEAIYPNAVVKKVGQAHYDSHELVFPEALTERPPRRNLKNKVTERPRLTISSIEVLERRRKVGLLGKPIPKTYLLQPIVEMYNSVWTDGYSNVKNKIWDANDLVPLTKSILTKMPISLGDKTNYYDAFWGPKYLNTNRSRIYHGSGVVKAISDGFIISSDVSTSVNGNTFAFQIKVYNALLHDDSLMSHLKLFKALEQYVNDKTPIRWYAYGQPMLVNNLYELLVVNLDYLYIKNVFKKKP
ncbi:hypothetical protein [Methylotenera sp.]|uniref:hypothetical protein n=1 Tax=Methylotenera sp. TaxID=2051956 RepID=UPI002EDB7B14